MGTIEKLDRLNEICDRLLAVLAERGIEASTETIAEMREKIAEIMWIQPEIELGEIDVVAMADLIACLTVAPGSSC